MIFSFQTGAASTDTLTITYADALSGSDDTTTNGGSAYGVSANVAAGLDSILGVTSSNIGSLSFSAF